MTKVYEAVLIRKDGDDFDSQECQTITEAKRTLKQMIGNRHFHDAYIRCFEKDEDGFDIRVYDIK